VTDLAVSARGLGKAYQISHRAGPRYLSLREVLAVRGQTFARRLLRPYSASPARQNREEFWALQDVSFDVKQGERLAIIGRNGAGKSTLLKLLSRITEPTAGRVGIRGRVATLLEVGTGFHPELTGRENVFLNGAILGMTRAEIRKKFDEIVAFAEVERFLDTPVKHYSSGMYVRLAFAVAAHLEPEILIVDEVLAVGDAQFQKKCLGKMEGVGRSGGTVLFVSHNMTALHAICDTGLLLSKGRVAKHGSFHQVARAYAAETEGAGPPLPIETHDITVTQFDVLQHDASTDRIDGNQQFDVVIAFEIQARLPDFRVGIYLNALGGETVMRSFLADWSPERETLERGKYVMRLTMPARFLAPGDYEILLHASRYGVVDYLHAYNVTRPIAVSAPADFNRNHPGEDVSCYVLSPRQWSLDRL
jgi:lipopolysaccharide transport system ATP-binding protein